MDISEQRLNMGGNMGRFGSSSMNLQDEMNNFSGSGGMMQGRGMMGMDASRFGDSDDFDRNPRGRGMMGMDSSGFGTSNDLNRNPEGRGMMGMDSSSGFRSSKD